MPLLYFGTYQRERKPPSQVVPVSAALSQRLHAEGLHRGRLRKAYAEGLQELLRYLQVGEGGRGGRGGGGRGWGHRREGRRISGSTGA